MKYSRLSDFDELSKKHADDEELLFDENGEMKHPAKQSIQNVLAYSKTYKVIATKQYGLLGNVMN